MIGAVLVASACGSREAGLLPAGGARAEDAGSPPSDPDSGTAEPTDAAVDAPEDPPTGDVERTYRLMQWNIAGGKENACRGPAIARAIRRFVKMHEIDFVSLNEVCQGASSIRFATSSAKNGGSPPK